MNRRAFVTGLGTLLAAPFGAGAQHAGRIPRIGLFSGGAPPGPNTFRQGLKDLGYVEGQNIVIEDRFAKSYADLRAVAAQLVSLRVGGVVAFGTPAAQVARDAIQTIPVVFVTFADPVQTGLVASLARPGRNLTGLTMITSELVGKRMELLKEGLPGVS